MVFLEKGNQRDYPNIRRRRKFIHGKERRK